MTLDEAINAAARQQPVLCFGINSADPSEYIRCRRIREVSFVVPEGRGGYWVAACEGELRSTVYRARIENIRPE